MELWKEALRVFSAMELYDWLGYQPTPPQATVSLNHPKNFKCQAFDKAAYREPADDWLLDPKPK